MPGSKSKQCQADGKCICNEGYTGTKCETHEKIEIEFTICNAIEKNKVLKGATIKLKCSGGGVTTIKSDENGYIKAGPYYAGQILKMEVMKDGYDKYSDEFTCVKNMLSKTIALNPTVSVS